MSSVCILVLCPSEGILITYIVDGRWFVGGRCTGMTYVDLKRFHNCLNTIVICFVLAIIIHTVAKVTCCAVCEILPAVSSDLCHPVSFLH
jgi:hypothetical protein